MGLVRKCVISAAILLTVVCGMAAEQRNEICLNGEWDIVFQGRASEAIPSTGWAPMRVPGSWAISGRNNFALPGKTADSRFAWYKRPFMVPSEWNDGRKIKLKFQLVEDAHKVFVNNKLVYSSDTLQLCREIDITGAVKFGENNELAVFTAWLTKGTEAHSANRTEAGIVRDVFLLTQPVTNIAFAHAIPDLANKKLRIRVKVRNEAATKQSTILKASVLDQGKPAVTFPETPMVVPANSEKVVVLEQVWENPVLWGFGEYGKPYLYHLKTELGAGNAGDVRYDRFGYREFTTAGTKLMFNGKPFFMKGDLLTRNYCHNENPAVIAAYFQRLRGSNINFQRMHSMWYKSNFDDGAWYQVGDEVGFPIEAQMSGFTSGINKSRAADDPAVFGAWEAFMQEHFNHPSLVMWSLNNETFSVGLTSRQNLAKIDQKALQEYDRLSSFVRKYDPTRLVEIHHNYSIYPFIKEGKFSKQNFMTFNIHPYGALRQRVNTEAKAVGFDYSVPILIGEIYAFPNPFDFLNNPTGTYAEQWRIGQSYYDQITDGAKAKGVSGEVLCAIQGDGYVGFKNADELYLGPWSDHALIKENGQITGIRDFKVKIDWPSLSGPGTKAEFIPAYGYRGGSFGLNFNWFDTSVPMFYNNIIDLTVKKAFREIDGKDVPPLETRAPEVIVCIGKNVAKGTYVYISPTDCNGPRRGVSVDANGTAWFRLWDPGEYRASCFIGGKLVEKQFTVKTRPVLNDKPGYHYLTWVDLRGNDSGEIRKRLAQPAQFIDTCVAIKGEMMTNGDMEFWSNTGSPVGWIGKAERNDDVQFGKYSALIKGNDGNIVQQIRLQKDATYRITGWIKKLAGNNNGILSIKEGHPSYKVLLSIPGPVESGKWVKIDKEYRATGTEGLFYCFNSYMGNDGKVLYDNISIRKTTNGTAMPEDLKFSPGPHDVGKGGFIRNWLVCGPLPNRGNEETGFEGHKTDWLKAYGGEQNIVPKFGDAVEVKFPENYYWRAKDVKISWKYLQSPKDLVKLDGIQLPELAICAAPPSNVCAYLSCIVVCPDDRQVKLGIGSDDGYKVFLNGKMVGELAESRGSSPDQEVYPVQLQKGNNILTMKLFQNIGGWNCYVHFLDQTGKPVTDIKIILKDK